MKISSTPQPGRSALAPYGFTRERGVGTRHSVMSGAPQLETMATTPVSGERQAQGPSVHESLQAMVKLRRNRMLVFGALTLSVAALLLAPTIAAEIIRANSSVVVWGSDEMMQTNAPAALTNVLAIASGFQWCMALKADGTVIGWGRNDGGEATGTPSKATPYFGSGVVTLDQAVLTNIVAIDGGGSFGLALRGDGTVVAWGNARVANAAKRFVSGELSDCQAIAAGRYHALVLEKNGTVFAWGSNGRGEVTGTPGIPPGDDASGYVSLNGHLLTDVRAIAAGSSASAALKADGTVVAWGNNERGQATVPTGLCNVVRVVTKGHHTLAIRLDGSAIGWGGDHWGQNDIPPILGPVTDITGGGLSFSCFASRRNGENLGKVQLSRPTEHPRESH